MKKIFIKPFFILAVLLLTACTDDIQSTFTPPVIDVPKATNTVVITQSPTETSGQIPTEELISETIEPAIIPQVSVTDFPDPTQYEWVTIVSGFNKPLGMTSFYGDRLLIYVLEQGGVIRIIENEEMRSDPFLDISNKIRTQGSEQGLLGIALDPNFSINGIFYLNYSNRDGDTVIARFQADEDRYTANPESEQIILTYNQPYSNHNGGNLMFGPDGFLYIGLGDGGSGGDPEMRAQNPDTLLGKMLRISVQDQDLYAIPSDNPYQGGGGRGEIWAMGLRNPWRYSFDRLTGDLWIADVGQGNWEEINFTPANSLPGLNYGWYYREGTHPFKGEPPNPSELIDPVYEYDHSMGSCSVTGGFVYRGEQLPEWYGVYLFGDFCNGKVWGILQTDDGGWRVDSLFETGVNISSFGEDVFGELYLIAHNGTLYQLRSK
ncbi:MAG: PQQ-dependent sugar dehydrogenase [Anaerolineaceae bacterium]|nr:PQQ-dependent sugar dehydrogenase [Anaerolineaceae bacterium]